jgi:hypothetical protein
MPSAIIGGLLDETIKVAKGARFFMLSRLILETNTTGDG